MENPCAALAATGVAVFELEDGIVVECRQPKPYAVCSWRREVLACEGHAWVQFGYLAGGRARITDFYGQYELCAGMYFSITGACVIEPLGEAPGLVVRQPDATCQRTFGGPVEARGRLRYIDGCTDSLLLSPVRRGEACLNYLHIPPGTRQTSHFHPSDRVGVIARGRGRCMLPDAGRALELDRNRGWIIRERTRHSFTTEPDVALDVIAWHPDSDTGPSDDDHPMLNRSLVGEGRSVRRL